MFFNPPIIVLLLLLFFLPSVSMIPRDFGKKLREIQNVGVTITPGSPRGWTTRAVECYYNAASEQKCAGIKTPSPARRQNIGWSSSPKQKENQRPTHWSDRASRSPHNFGTVIDSEKRSINANRKSNMGFPTSHQPRLYVTPNFHKMGLSCPNL